MIEMSRGLAIHYQTAGDEQRCHRNTSVTVENVSKMECVLNSACIGFIVLEHLSEYLHLR